VLIVLVVATALVFDFTNGFHDTATAVATSVSTRALSPRMAVALAAVMNFVGALVTTSVARTISEDIVNVDAVTNQLVLSALIGAIAWNLITWWAALPSSSTYALVGGLIGAAWVTAGSSAIRWDLIGRRVALPALTSPLIGLVVAAIVMLAVYWGFRHKRPGPLNRGFRLAQIGSGSLVALGHGASDAQKTMGVIVLQGRAQAREIEQRLLDRLGAEVLEARRIVCGEPYSFQGDERDVIFLSMVAAPNATIGTLTRPPDQRRFNVAASRARDQMWLFHSATLEHLSEKCLRYRLLDYFANPQSRISKALGEEAENLRRIAANANRGIETVPPPFESWFELDIALAIAGKGYRVVPQFQIADKRIDLLIEGSTASLAVECDGDTWHGPEQYADDMHRQRKLERMGWQFWRIRDSAYYANQEQSLRSLWHELDRLRINPVA
jgi:phosphate/sulfate permease/very-short-patch-repair endonuclease